MRYLLSISQCPHLSRSWLFPGGHRLFNIPRKGTHTCIWLLVFLSASFVLVQECFVCSPWLCGLLCRRAPVGYLDQHRSCVVLRNHHVSVVVYLHVGAEVFALCILFYHYCVPRFSQCTPPFTLTLILTLTLCPLTENISTGPPNPPKQDLASSVLKPPLLPEAAAAPSTSAGRLERREDWPGRRWQRQHRPQGIYNMGCVSCVVVAFFSVVEASWCGVWMLRRPCGSWYDVGHDRIATPQ